MNLDIDPLNLFEECRRNPKLMADVSTDLARATKRVNIYYKRSKFLRGLIAKGCRLDPIYREGFLEDAKKKYEWIIPYIGSEEDISAAKITDSAVDAMVNSHPGILSLEMELIDFQYEENILKGHLNSIYDRRDELKQLVSLTIRNMGSDAEVDEETMRRLTTQQINEELQDDVKQLRQLALGDE